MTDAEMIAELERLSAENVRLRAALATSKDPCVYCQLPAEETGKCKAGFPGCARMDDLMGCPGFGAMQELDAVRGVAGRAAEAIAALEAERDAAYARGLEDAAKVAEDAREHVDTATGVNSIFWENRGCAKAAAAIRALKPGEAE